jgi:hypothetical protein
MEAQTCSNTEIAAIRSIQAYRAFDRIGETDGSIDHGDGVATHARHLVVMLPYATNLI